MTTCARHSRDPRLPIKKANNTEECNYDGGDCECSRTIGRHLFMERCGWLVLKIWRRWEWCMFLDDANNELVGLDGQTHVDTEKLIHLFPEGRLTVERFGRSIVDFRIYLWYENSPMQPVAVRYAHIAPTGNPASTLQKTNACGEDGDTLSR